MAKGDGKSHPEENGLPSLALDNDMSKSKQAVAVRRAASRTYEQIKKQGMIHSWRFTTNRPSQRKPVSLFSIGNGSHDPFDAAAVCINEFNRELAPLWGPQYMFAFLDPLATERSDLDPMWCWLRILVDDEGALHAAYTCAYLMGSIIAPAIAEEHDYSKKGRKHYGKAISLLRKNSWSPETIHSAVHANIVMCAFAFMAGDVKACRVHHQGLRILIQRAGGITALSQTLRNVLMHGLTAASCLLLEPCPVDLEDFNCHAWHKEPSVAKFRDTLPLYFLYSSTPLPKHLPFPRALVIHDDVRASIQCMLHDCREVLLIQAQVYQVPKSNLKTLLPVKAWMETRFNITILMVINLSCKLSEDREQLWSCCCVALWCCHSLIYNTRHDPRHVALKPIQHLELHLEKLLRASGPLYRELYSDVFLWMTFLAAYGQRRAAPTLVKGSEDFIMHLKRMTENAERAEIKNKLLQFLYDEEILGPFLSSMVDDRREHTVSPSDDSNSSG